MDAPVEVLEGSTAEDGELRPEAGSTIARHDTSILLIPSTLVPSPSGGTVANCANTGDFSSNRRRDVALLVDRDESCQLFGQFDRGRGGGRGGDAEDLGGLVFGLADCRATVDRSRRVVVRAGHVGWRCDIGRRRSGTVTETVLWIGAGFSVAVDQGGDVPVGLAVLGRLFSCSSLGEVN